MSSAAGELAAAIAAAQIAEAMERAMSAANIGSSATTSLADAKAAADVKATAEAEAKAEAKARAEAKAKAEAEAKAEARAKADAEAQAKIDASYAEMAARTKASQKLILESDDSSSPTLKSPVGGGGGGILGALSRRMSWMGGSPDNSSPSPDRRASSASPSSKLLGAFAKHFSIRGLGLSEEDQQSIRKQSRIAALLPTNDEVEDEATSAVSDMQSGGVKAKVRRTVWKSMRKNLPVVDRASLEKELRDNVSDPDLNVVVKLAHALIDSKHHSSSASYSGALLMEWASYRGFELSSEEQLLLAKAHAEVWISRGMSSERYNLDRAKHFYETWIAADQLMADSNAWIEYGRVLSYFGEKHAAANILKQVISSFEDDPEISSHMFCLGAALKTCERHEEASNYFFESTMTGPPKHLSKLQMMFIISRNIEEESRKSETQADDAYAMVHQHMQLEGYLAEDLDYDTWISDSSTWRKLGDMCALHGAHSLACDLYGQGLMRDQRAFKKPKLWFSFAKACKRCGRTADAALAIKQALTMDPFNQQLLRASELAERPTHDFEALIEDDELGPILETLPKSKVLGVSGALKLQALQRGKAERKGLRVLVASGGGAGASRAIGGARPKKMIARVGVLLGGVHPVILSARATWLGSVSEIVATDLEGQMARLKFKNPFTPIKESRDPRKLLLSLVATPDEKYDRHVLVLRFVDQDTGEYVQRSLTLSYREHDAEGHLVHMVHQKGQKEDEETDKAAERHVGRNWSLLESLRFKDDHDIRTNIVDAEVERGCFLHHGVSYLYHVMNQEQNTIVKIFQACSDRQIVFQMQREHLDRNKELKRSVVKLMDIVHAYPRLHDILVGRRRNTQQDDHISVKEEESLTECKADGEGEGEEKPEKPEVEAEFDPAGFWHNTHGNREGIIYSNNMLVLVRILPDVHGETIVRLFEANGCPLLGHAIEDVDAEALTQDLPSRKKRRDRESFVAEVMGKEPASSAPLFSAPIQAVVVAEVSTPRELETADDPGLAAAAARIAATAAVSAAAATTTASTSAAAGRADEPDLVIDDDDFDEDGDGSPEEGSSAVATKSESPKRRAKNKAVHALGESGFDSPISGSPRTGGDSSAAREEGGPADEPSLEEETPMQRRARQRRQKQEREREREDASASSGDGAVSGSGTNKDEPMLIKMTSKASTNKPRDHKPSAAVPALQPVRARFVAVRDNTLRDGGPEQADKVKRRKEEAKRAKEQAAQQALNYMRHQQAVGEAKEYVLDRARRAIWSVGTEEARAYLLRRVAQAKQIVIDLLAAAALQEAADKARREEEEAAETARQTAAKLAAAKGNKRASFKEAAGARSSGGSMKQGTGTRASMREKDKALAQAVGNKLGISLQQGSPRAFDPTALDDMGQGQDETLEQGDAGEGDGEAVGALEGRESAARPGSPHSTAPDDAADPSALGLGPDYSAAPAFAIAPGSGGVGGGDIGDEQSLADSGLALSKRERKPLYVTRDAPPRQPKKITINHPPALTARQRQELRREWGPEDVPAWAYDSPGDLVAALRGFYDPAQAQVQTQTQGSGLELGLRVSASAPLVSAVAGAFGPDFWAPAEPEAETGTVPDVVAVPASATEAAPEALPEAATEAATEAGSGAGAATEAGASDEAAEAKAGMAVPALALDLAVEVPTGAAEGAGPAEPQTLTQSEPEAKVEAAVVPLHLRALLDPRAVSSSGAGTGAGKAAQGGSQRVLANLLRRLKPSEVAEVARPLPINAALSASAFRPDGLFDVSVTKDARFDAIKKHHSALLQAQGQAQGLGIGMGAKAGQRPASTSSSSGAAAAFALGPFSSVGSASPSRRTTGTGSGSAPGSAAHIHPFDPPRQHNPLSFLAEPFGLDGAEAGQAAMAAFDARGYSDGSSPYGSLWRLKLLRCAELFPDPRVLRKRIATLRKTSPRPVTRLEAFCALADSAGSATEALGRLAEEEYHREVRTVCAMLPVASLLAGLGVAWEEGAETGTGAGTGTGTGEGESWAGESGALDQAAASRVRTPQRFLRPPSSSAAPSSVASASSPDPAIRPEPDSLTLTLSASALAAAAAPPVGSPSAPRLAGPELKRLLPHLNMRQASPIVQSRGTTIRLAAGAYPSPLSPALGQGQSLGLDLGLGSGSGTRGGAGLIGSPAYASPDGWAGLGEGSLATLQTDPRLDALQFASPFASPSRQSPSGGLGPGLGQQQSSPLRAPRRDGRPSTTAGIVTTSGIVSAATSSPVKSLRLGSAIDALYEQAPPSMVVMCRRDAQRAAAEELLVRSPHKKIRDAASKRSLAWERYSAKLQNHGSPAPESFE